MEINISQTVWLRYNLRYTATGEPRYGLARTEVFLWYAVGATADWTGPVTPDEADFYEHSLGAYAVKISGDLLTTTGPFYSMITDAATLPWTAQATREDIVVSGDAPGLGYVVTAYITEDEGGSSVPCIGASVQVRDSTGLTILTQGVTDGNGEIAFTLASGTYELYVWKAGMTFSESPKTFVVSTDTAVATEGVDFLPEAPDMPATSIVYGTLIDVSSGAKAGVVLGFDLINAAHLTNASAVLVSSVQKTTTTDANGGFAIQLIPNPLIEPTGTKYRVTVQTVPRQSAVFSVLGTGGDSFDISDLIT